MKKSNKTMVPEAQRPGPGGSPPERSRHGRSVAKDQWVTDAATAEEKRSFMREVPVGYGRRPEGSQSKLNTFGDGLRILFTILLLLKEFRPFVFFATCSGLMALLSLAFGLPVVAEYLSTGLVPRFPTAILASALMIIAGISLAPAFILDSVGRGRKEFKRLAYLAQARWSGAGAGMPDDP